MSEALGRRYLEDLLKREIPESLTLEYKASAALSREGKSPENLSKDASAMANSEGGRIIYGMLEDNHTHKPIGIDGGAGPSIDREWIEHILTSWVHPKIEGLKITAIELSPNHHAYVVDIPQARSLAPHQAGDNRYYRRHNFKIQPMEDYEVRDMMRRATTPALRVTASWHNGEESQPIKWAGNTSEPLLLQFTLHNLSRAPASHAIVELIFERGLDCVSTSGHGPHRSMVIGWPVEMLCFRTVFPMNDGLPVFYENPVSLGGIRFRLSLARYQNDGAGYFMGWRAIAPGCSSQAKGQITTRFEMASFSLLEDYAHFSA